MFFDGDRQNQYSKTSMAAKRCFTAARPDLAEAASVVPRPIRATRRAIDEGQPLGNRRRVFNDRNGVVCCHRWAGKFIE